MRTTKPATMYSLLLELKTFSVLAKSCMLLMGLFLINSCIQNDKSKANDRLVAKVFNKSLFQTELNDLIGPGTLSEDSAQIANAYIEKWVRESIMMHEAEKYVPKDLNIDELVRDYRASLIRHNYEMLLVETRLDSVINEPELDAYYQENKEQYKLKSPIIRCHFIKLPKSAEGLKEAKDWWKSDDDEDFKRLLDYSSRNAAVYMLNSDLWYSLDDVSQHLPKGTLTSGNYKSKKTISTNDDDFEYLLKIFDTTSSGQYAPLAFIQDQATKVILHKRKIKLLEEKREEMYEKETGSNNVKIYVE